MLRPSGQLFHMGFGGMLGNHKRKTGLLRGSAPFVVTKDFENVIVATNSSNDNDDDDDDAVRSMKWKEFVSMGARAFGIVCRNAHLFVTLFSLMLPAQLPELTDLKYLENVLISTTTAQVDDKGSTTTLEDRWEKLIRQESFASTTINNLIQIVRNPGGKSSSSQRNSKTNTNSSK